MYSEKSRIKVGDIQPEDIYEFFHQTFYFVIEAKYIILNDLFSEGKEPERRSRKYKINTHNSTSDFFAVVMLM